MPDEKATNVAPQDQAKASEPAKPAPQDNGSETPAASATPGGKAQKKKKKDDDGSSGRGSGLHR